MRDGPTAEDISRDLTARIADVVRDLYPGAEWFKDIAYCSAKDKKSLGSFQVTVKGPHAGQWCRFSQPSDRGGQVLGGMPIHLISYSLTGRTTNYKEAFEWARRFLNIEDRPESHAEIEARNRRARDAEAKRLRGEADATRQQAGKVATATEIWRATERLSLSSVRYFGNRGLDESIPVDPQLRFHPSLWCVEAGRNYPAIVALVRDAQGKGCAIWRIYLSEDGSQKAAVGSPKLGLGPAGGGAVRLAGLARKIGIAEGLETALACAELCGRAHPVWTGLSTSGLIGWQCPAEIEDVTIYGDADAPRVRNGLIIQPGLDAAERLKARLLDEGKRCRIVLPPMGMDFLDLLVMMKKRGLIGHNGGPEL